VVYSIKPEDLMEFHFFTKSKRHAGRKNHTQPMVQPWDAVSLSTQFEKMKAKAHFITDMGVIIKNLLSRFSN